MEYILGITPYRAINERTISRYEPSNRPRILH